MPKELHAPGGVFVALTSLGLQGCHDRPNPEPEKRSGQEMWMGIPPSTAWRGFPTHAWCWSQCSDVSVGCSALVMLGSHLQMEVRAAETST